MISELLKHGMGARGTMAIRKGRNKRGRGARSKATERARRERRSQAPPKPPPMPKGEPTPSGAMQYEFSVRQRDAFERVLASAARRGKLVSVRATFDYVKRYEFEEEDEDSEVALFGGRKTDPENFLDNEMPDYTSLHSKLNAWESEWGSIYASIESSRTIQWADGLQGVTLTVWP